MKRSVILTLGLVALVAAVAFAQAKPNFSGTWALDTEKSEMGAPGGGGGGGRAGGGGRGGGGPMTITQTATELTVARTMGGNEMKTVYKLDGTPTTNETARGTSTATAKWDGAKLVITTKTESPNGTRESTQTWSMSAEGELIQESTMGQGGTRKMVYKKQ